MKRGASEVDADDRRHDILSHNVSDQEKRQIQRHQRMTSNRSGAPGGPKKGGGMNTVPRKAADIGYTEMNQSLKGASEHMMEAVTRHVNTSLQKYGAGRAISRTAYSAKVAEKELADPVSLRRRELYAKVIFGTDAEKYGGIVDPSAPFDRQRPCLFLGVALSKRLTSLDVYRERLSLELPAPTTLPADPFYMTANSGDGNTDVYERTITTPLDCNLSLPGITRYMESIYDLTVFEIHAIAPAPEWAAGVAGLVVVDYMIDDTGTFILRFVYGVVEVADNDHCYSLAATGQMAELVSKLSRARESSEHATINRFTYHNAATDLKIELSHLPLQAMGYYYIVPSPDSNRYLDERAIRDLELVKNQF